MSEDKDGPLGLTHHIRDGKLVAITGPNGERYVLQEQRPDPEPEPPPPPKPDFTTAIWALVVDEIEASLMEVFGDGGRRSSDGRDYGAEAWDWFEDFAEEKGVK